MARRTASISDPNSLAGQLERLFTANHPCIHVVTTEERYAIERINEALMGTLDAVWYWSAVRGLYSGLLDKPDPIKETEHPAAALFFAAEKLNDQAVLIMLDLSAHLDDARVLRAARETIQRFRENGGTLILLDHQHDLPRVIQAQAARIEVARPSEKELHRIVRATLQDLHRRKPVRIDLKKRELDIIVRNLRGLSRSEARQIVVECVSTDRVFDINDMNTVLAHKRQQLQADGVLEYVETPVDLSSIGGLRRLKTWLKHRDRAWTDEAASFGIDPPRGVLMLGVQGGGKSMCAKAIATAWRQPLLRLDPGTLYDRYIGESERRLRGAFEQAERMAPIVLWIDEIEKGFASAASQSTDGGLSQRMFGALLTWMQEHVEPVFLVATANNIEALPPELLRKGRFDEVFFIDLPTRAVRKQIFSIHLKKRERNPDQFDVGALADAAEGFSGAEIEQVVIAALHAAFADHKQLSNARLQAAIAATVPLSVTMAEQVSALRRRAATRCAAAD